MEKEFIPYEQALALKELGFEKICFAFFDVDKSERFDTPSRAINWNKQEQGENYINEYISRPLYQQAFDWFRKEFKLKGDVFHADSNGSYKIVIWKWNYDNNEGKWERISFISSFNDYEEARLECLKQLIKDVSKIRSNKR